MDLLKRLADAAGKKDMAARRCWRKIRAGFDKLEAEKLAPIKQKRQQERLEHAQLDEYPAEFAEALVCQSGQEPKLGPVEKRAVARLSGELPERRKTLIEDRAAKLERRVRAEWPTRPAPEPRRRGRPAGSSAMAIVGTADDAILIPVSIAEAVALVLPPIEALAGSKIMPTVRGRKGDEVPSSLGLEAVLVAVRLLCGTAELQAVRRAVAQVHRDQTERPPSKSKSARQSRRQRKLREVLQQRLATSRDVPE
jgi:hypothetical protein